MSTNTLGRPRFTSIGGLKQQPTLPSSPFDQETAYPLQELKNAIAPLRSALLSHPVYDCLTNAAALQIFMEHHIFAVWDFMSLLKRLQQQLTCTHLPWIQPENSNAARLINEIVLAEETDIAQDGHHASHFQLYLEAMKQVSADQSAIQDLQALLQHQIPLNQALSLAKVPEAAMDFVRQSLEVCKSDDPVVVAAYFLFGRENLIPDLFTQIVVSLEQSQELNGQGLKYYLDRHIELDSNQHGPAGEQLLISLCDGRPQAWQKAKESAIASLQSRLQLWDGIEATILLNQLTSIRRFV